MLPIFLHLIFIILQRNIITSSAKQFYRQIRVCDQKTVATKEKQDKIWNIYKRTIHWSNVSDDKTHGTSSNTDNRTKKQHTDKHYQTTNHINTTNTNVKWPEIESTRPICLTTEKQNQWSSTATSMCLPERLWPWHLNTWLSKCPKCF